MEIIEAYNAYVLETSVSSGMFFGRKYNFTNTKINCSIVIAEC